MLPILQELGKGFLTGAIDDKTVFDKNDFRNVVPRFAEKNRKANAALVALLGAIVKGHGVTRAQIPWPGCWRNSRGSHQFPVPPSCIGWKKTLPPPMSP